MKHAWAYRGVLLLFGVLHLAVGRSHAQTENETAEQLSRKSTVIAVGTVSAIRSEWTPDRERIVTRVNITVDEYVKGNTGAGMLTVIVPGGEVNGVGELYTHTATFRNNEHVLVFAEQDAQGTYRVVDGERGKINVMRDEATGRRIINGNQPFERLLTLVKIAVKAQDQE